MAAPLLFFKNFEGKKMKDEDFFDESDIQRIRAKSSHGGTASELHIPRNCFTCEGEPGWGRDCLGIYCPIFTVNSKEPDEDQYISDLLSDRRMLREALLDARAAKESLRKAKLFNLAR
jgi:hypothetical protein